MNPPTTINLLENFIQAENGNIIDADEERGITFKVAQTVDEREQCWALTRRIYAEKGYAGGGEGNPLWYSIYDALPTTVTVMAEIHGELAGTMTVVRDSPLGLPIDETYPEVANKARAAGWRLSETVSLVQASDSAKLGMHVVAELCELAWIVAEFAQGATDMLVSVNPRHENFYRRAMGFELLAGERPCGRVQGAPAVCLRLNCKELAKQHELTRRGAARTLYTRFMDRHEAQLTGKLIKNQMQPLPTEEVERLFARERPLLQAQPFEKMRYLADTFPGLARILGGLGISDALEEEAAPKSMAAYA